MLVPEIILQPNSAGPFPCNPVPYTSNFFDDFMATYAQLAAKLLRDAATFFRNVGDQNAPLKEQMNDNAAVYEQVADLLEKNPMGILDLGDEDNKIKK